MTSLLKSAFGLTFVVLLLTACGGTITNPVSQTTAPTQIPPTAAPTQIPPTQIPPTATITPLISQADSTLAGPMTISQVGDGASAQRGEIEFTTSADGTAIVSVSVSLYEMNCSYEFDVTFAGVRQSGSGTETAGSGTTSSHGTFPITNGKFDFDTQSFQGTGQITSPTEANGVISILQKIYPSNLPPTADITCDYGTWTWNASVP